MKTSELTGALLDYWVAKAVCESHEVGSIEFHADNLATVGGELRVPYRPSTYWSQGGPIIERLRMSVIPADFEGKLPDSWVSFVTAKELGKEVGGKGTTPLIAAMRAVVLREFGKEVPEVV